MKLKHKIFTAVLSAIVALPSCIGFCKAAEPKLQLYFSPTVMNDRNGEITVDADIRNFNTAVDKNDTICAVTFAFEYDDEHFTLKTENGKPVIILDDTALVKKLSDTETSIDAESGKVTMTFIDNTLTSNLIKGDGKLFSFMLIAKEPQTLWNSSDRYPIRFVENSLGVVTYDTDDYKVGRLYNTEGIDVTVGGYNTPPLLVGAPINKHITFNEGETKITVDGEVKETDAAPFKNDGGMMIPIRYLAENIGMSVEWDGSVMTAAAYGEYKTLKVKLDQDGGNVFVNSANIYDFRPIERDGRIYVSSDFVSELYTNAQITKTDSSVDIYIP